MVTISAPLASAGTWVNNPAPGGTIIQAVAGENFLVRHELEWSLGTDGVTNDGAYTITMSWLSHENNADENFTFLMAEAYFTTGAWIGAAITADVTLASAPDGENTKWALSVKHPVGAKDNRNGQFNVDIWLGAFGAGGVPHTATGPFGDNHPIPPAVDGDQLGGVIVYEPGMIAWNRSPITIDVVGVGVTVDVTPASQSDWTGIDLDYTVTVTNTGEAADSFDLTWVDSANPDWDIIIVPGTLALAGSGGSDTAIMTVTVGSGTDNVTVTATGTYASDSDSVLAIQTQGPNVDVEVEPNWAEDLPGNNLLYSVVTTNTGTVLDNITVSVGDSEGWNVHFSTTTLNPTDDGSTAENDPLTVLGSGTYYQVRIGYDVVYGDLEEIAFLQFDLSGISSGATINSADLIIMSKYGPGRPGYLDENMDVSALEAGDDWDETTLCWDNQPVYENTLDTVTVQADSEVGQYVDWTWDVTSSVASEVAGDQVVSFAMISENVPENITASFYSKDEGTPSYLPRLVVNYTAAIPAGGFIVELSPDENDTRNVTVEIPLAAVPSTTNNVTVTATSEVDNTVSDSETVEAHVVAAVNVDVENIDPQWQEQHANKSLTYSVTIVNLGAAPDTFDVVLSDTEGWNPTWAGGDDLIISEYIEGGSYNKAIEIYNGTGAPVDLSAYKLGLWSNGKTEPDGYPNEHVLSGILASGDVWVGAHKSANAAILAVADWIDTASWPNPQVINHNGDDGYTLRMVSDDSVVDAIGEYDVDPGSEWPGDGKDQTHVRKMTILSGDTNFYDNGFTFATEWDKYNKDNTDFLGGHPGTVLLDNGESITLEFSVTLPADVIPSTTDIITVTATSHTDDTVSDSEDAEAHAGLMRGVEAVIEGDNWQETHKDPLTYVIKIHNTGQIADMYKLTAYDEQGWPLHIEPQEIYLKPSHSAQAALSVTIPYQEPGSSVDDIWVIIKGKLASGTFSDPENVQVRVDVQAHSREVWGVDLNVYPSIHQTGHPDSPLTWLVTVTNTGNVPDVISLDLLGQYVYDLVGTYGAWAGGFQPGDVTHMDIQLEAGEEASILLTLLVPDTEDMRTGVHNEITIGATSLGSYLTDEQTVVAQVRQQMPHVPQGEIKLQAVAGYVAIDIWPTYYDFGVLNEMEQRATPADYFTVRNVGNVYVDVSIVGMDATSKPGEPAAKWTLGDGAIGVDMYALWWTSGGEIVDTVTKVEKYLDTFLEPGNETYLDLKIQAPSTFTTPAKMWTKVAITARKLHPQPEQ